MSIYVKYVELLKLLRSYIFSGEELSEKFVKVFIRNNKGKLDAADSSKENDIFKELIARAQSDLEVLPVGDTDFKSLKENANILKTIREQSQISEQAARYAASFNTLNRLFAQMSDVQKPYDQSFLASVPGVLEGDASKFENQDARYKFYNVLRTYSKVCSGKLAKVSDLNGRMLWSPSLVELVAKVDDGVKKVGFNVLLYKDISEELSALPSMNSIPEAMRFRVVVTLIKLKCDSLNMELPSISAMTVCPTCGEKVSAGNICSKCNSYIKCPGCGKPIQKDSKQCVGCGVEVAKIATYEKVLSDAQFKINTGSIAGIEEALREFETNWAKYDKLIKIKEQYLAIKENISRQERSLNEAISALKFQEAKQIAAKLIEKNSTPLLEKSLKEINAKIDSAAEIVKRAQSAMWFDKISIFKQALNVCSDYAEAIKGLADVVPLSPSRLDVKVVGRTVKIQWDRVNSSFVSYVVVRKMSSAPANSGDGDLLATLNGDSYDDTTCVAGVSYYYAVFAKVENKCSMSGASFGPVLTVADMDIKSLKYDVKKDHISFSYSIPKGAKLIEIYRDGRLLKSLTGTNFIDQGLQADRELTYKFVAVYEDIAGKKHSAGGVSISLIPTAPPEAVDIQIEDMGDKAVIRWQAPRKGVLEIFSSSKPFAENKNDMVYKESFSYDKLLISGNSSTVNKNFNGLRYFIPVVFSGGMGIVGEQQQLVSLLELDNLTMEKIGDRTIEVNWSWEKGIDSLVITTQIDGGKEIPNTISKANQSKTTFTATAPKEAKSITITVQTRLIGSNGEVLLSKGEKRVFSLQVAKIAFKEVKVSGFLMWKKYSLTISTNTPLPCDLELLIGEGRTPIDLNNYKSHLTIKSSSLTVGEATTFEFQYSRKNSSKPLIFRLIPADQSKYKMMVIMPETKQIK